VHELRLFDADDEGRRHVHCLGECAHVRQQAIAILVLQHERRQVHRRTVHEDMEHRELRAVPPGERRGLRQRMAREVGEVDGTQHVGNRHGGYS
jgi:hypothetical protein